MAVIKSGDSTTQLTVDTASKAARVSLYDPATGLPMASYIRGTGFDLDTSANVDMRDAIAIAVPGAGGAQIAGVASTPLRTDPTGTTVQPVSGTVAVSNHPAIQPVSGTVTVANPVNAVQVNNFPTSQAVTGSVAVTNFPGTQQVAGSMSVTNFPGTQQVAGAVTVSNLPATQQVAGTVTANVRVNSADVTTANPMPVNAVGSVAVTNTDANPVSVSIVPADPGASFTAVFDVVPTTLSDATTYWSIRNAGTKVVYIRRMDLQTGFYGVSASSRTSFYIVRYTGTVAGGASVTPVKKNSNSVGSGVAILTANAGLTTTGVTWEAGQIHRIANVNSNYNFASNELEFGATDAEHIQLQPGEGLAIRASGPIVSGSFVTGSIGWREK